MGKDVVEYSADLGLRREHEVNHGELGLHPARYLVPTSSRGTHRGDELDVLYFFEDLVLGPVEPASVVHPLPQQLERGLREVGVLLGHVEVIDVDHHFFAIRDHLGLGPPHHLPLDHLLGLGRTSLTRVYNVVDPPILLVQFVENLVD